jgi:hypothetical protein
MKSIVSALFALAVLAALVIAITISSHGVRSVYAQSGCSVASLTGNYGSTFSGFELEAGKSVPFYGAGLITFDGTGNLSGTFALSQNGALPGNKYVVQTNVPYTATYTVNSDCTGVVTGAPGSDSFAIVIVSGGAEILGTDITPSSTIALDAKK